MNVCPPPADYWGGPSLGTPLLPVWRQDGLASLGVQTAMGLMHTEWMPMPMSCKDRPPTRKAEALSEGTAKIHGPCDAVEAIGLSSERSQRAMSGRERERTSCWQGGRLAIATPGEAGRDGVAWSPGLQVESQRAIHSIHCSLWGGRIIQEEDAAKLMALAPKAAWAGESAGASWLFLALCAVLGRFFTKSPDSSVRSFARNSRDVAFGAMMMVPCIDHPHNAT